MESDASCPLPGRKEVFAYLDKVQDARDQVYLALLRRESEAAERYAELSGQIKAIEAILDNKLEVVK